MHVWLFDFNFRSAVYIIGCGFLMCLLTPPLLHTAGPGPGSAKLGVKTIAAIIIGRLILVPPAGLGIVTLADRFGFLPEGDKMFRFVLLLQHTMPTSVLSGK